MPGAVGGGREGLNVSRLFWIQFISGSCSCLQTVFSKTPMAGSVQGWRALDGPGSGSHLTLRNAIRIFLWVSSPPFSSVLGIQVDFKKSVEKQNEEKFTLVQRDFEIRVFIFMLCVLHELPEDPYRVCISHFFCTK